MTKFQTSKPEWAFLASLTLVSLLLIWIFSTPEFFGDDAVSHFQFAADGQNWGYWLDPKAFNGNYFPMGYGSLLAIGLRVFDGQLIAIQVIQAIMGASLAWLGWILLWNQGRTVRIATFAVIAISPATISMATQNGYEIVLAFTMMAALTLTYRLRTDQVKAQSLAWASLLLAGFLLSVGLLCQGKILVLIPVFLILIWRQPILRRLAFLGMTFAPVALWSLRNRLILNSWNPFSSNSSTSLWLGNNWEATNGELLVNPPAIPARFHSVYEASANFIISQPEKAFALQLRKIARLLEPNYLRPDWQVLPAQNLILNSAMIALSCAGVLLFAAYFFGRIWAKPPVLPPVGWMAVFVSVYFFSHFPFLAEPRYTSPIIPIGACVSVPTAVYLFRRVRHQASSRATKGSLHRNRLRKGSH